LDVMSKKKSPTIAEPWPPVLTADEAAGIIRRSTKTVQRYVSKGVIKGLDAPGPYLISSDALRAFIRGDKEPQR